MKDEPPEREEHAEEAPGEEAQPSSEEEIPPALKQKQSKANIQAREKKSGNEGNEGNEDKEGSMRRNKDLYRWLHSDGNLISL